MHRTKGEIDIVGYYDVELPKIPIILDDVRCRGNESSLIQCPNTGLANHNCVHYEDIVLDCRGTIHKSENHYSLVQHNGRSLAPYYTSLKGYMT